MGTESSAAEWVELVTQLVTAGGFGALVWYLVVKHIPSIEVRHKEERESWRRFVKDRDESLERILVDVCESMNDLKNELRAESVRKSQTIQKP